MMKGWVRKAFRWEANVSIVARSAENGALRLRDQASIVMADLGRQLQGRQWPSRGWDAVGWL